MRTENETNIDPIFGVPSHTRWEIGAFTTGENSPEYRQAHQLHAATRALRAQILGEPAASKSDRRTKKITTLSEDRIFQKGTEVARLLTSLEKTQELLQYRRQLPLIQEKTFEKIIKGAENSGLSYYDKGSESFVFINEAKDFVYKITPIKDLVLDIPAIEGNSALYARPIAHPFCDQFGNLSLFQRNELFNLLPGLAKTEILAISETSHLITKQAFLGEEEPTMRELAKWAQKHKYAILPPQEDDPQKIDGIDLPMIEGASSALPIALKIKNTQILALDVVPRNARKLPNGDIALFDLTARVLLEQEIQTHPQLKKAFASLKDKEKKGLSSTRPKASTRTRTELKIS